MICTVATALWVLYPSLKAALEKFALNPISYDATLGKIEVRIDCTCAPNIYAVLERCSTPSKGGPESLKYKVVMKDLNV